MIGKFAIAAALALGACHAGSDNSADAKKAFPVTAHPARGVPNEQPLHRAEIAKVTKMMPPALQGRWGMNPGDCDVSRHDTNGLLVIAKDKLEFYGASATIDALSKKSQEEVTVDLIFSGDGKTWQRREHFQTVVGDTRLQRTEESPHETFHYTRC